MATVYYNNDEYKSAEEYYLLSTEIWKYLASENWEKHAESLKDSYESLNTLYIEMGDLEKAKYYKGLADEIKI